MNNNQLARKARRQLRRRLAAGALRQTQFNQLMEATFNDDVLTKWNAGISEAQLNPWEHRGVLMQSVKGFDFSNIWDWFAENWDEILRILLLLLPLFLGEEE